MTTLRDQAIRLVDRGQDHHRRGAPHRVRAVDAEETEQCPRYRYVAVGPDGTEVKDALEAPSEDALRNELLLRNLEVKQSSRRRRFNEIELTPQRVPKPGDHALLAPDGRVRAHRHPDHRGARGRRGGLGQQALPADPRRRCASRSTTACRSPTRSPSTPTVFPPYYIGILQLGRADRPARHRRSSSSRATSSATSRRKSKIKAALIYPIGRSSACRS